MVSTETLTAKHSEFVSKLFINGFNATKAYSEVYPDNKTPEFSASRLLSNVKIKAEIEQRQSLSAKKAGRTVQDLDNMYQRAYDLAEHRNDPNTNSMNGSTLGLARLYGMDKDNNARESTVIVINPPSNVKKTESEVIENE